MAARLVRFVPRRKGGSVPPVVEALLRPFFELVVNGDSIWASFLSTLSTRSLLPSFKDKDADAVEELEDVEPDAEEEEEEAAAEPLKALFIPQTGSKFFSFQGSIWRFSLSSSARSRVCISGVNSPSWSRSFHSTKALAKNSLFRAVPLKRTDGEEEMDEEGQESQSGRRVKR